MSVSMTPPEGVLQFTRNDTTLVTETFKRGDFDRSEIKVRTVEGWRAATKEEARWYRLWRDEFVEHREAQIAAEKETSNAT